LEAAAAAEKRGWDLSRQREQAANKLLADNGMTLHVPDEAMRSSLLGFGVPPWIAGMTVEYGRAYAAGWGDFTTTHVADVLGRAPRSFESFVREQWPRRAA